MNRHTTSDGMPVIGIVFIMTIAISPDAKWILGGLAAGFVLLGTMIVGAFLSLDSRIDAIAVDVATIKSTLEAHVEHGD